jgi:hypothetical protein
VGDSKVPKRFENHASFECDPRLITIGTAT